MDVDKHKVWLILGITIAIIVVGILVLAPSITEGVFGKAIAADKPVSGVIELTEYPTDDGSRSHLIIMNLLGKYLKNISSFLELVQRGELFKKFVFV